jgi:flagellar hook protein FlgE
MLRSLYSAISGIKNHQVKMDVIGNNIANVNTTGFKRSRVSFATTLSQTMKGAFAPTTISGGTNPIQIGMGAILGSIDQVMTQGSSQSTDKNTDMMVQGSGFFILDNNGVVYSRAGTFGLDSEGSLIDPATGAKVQGVMFADEEASEDASAITTTVEVGPPAVYTQPDLTGIEIKIGSGLYNTEPEDGAATLDSYTIDKKGVITGVYITPAVEEDGVVTTEAISTTAKIGQIAIASFANAAGLESIGNNFYKETPNSGAAISGEAGTTGHGTIVSNTIEMSNVDLSTEFTDMIVAQRGFQSNSRVITVSDSLLEELINLKRS